MKANASTVLVGQKVILVPYEAKHVPRYHEWMQNPELRELTASEELSLEEEFEMQRKWREDEDKLTFIVLASSDQLQPNSGSDSVIIDPNDSHLDVLPMVGDVNLFLSGEIPSSSGSSDRTREMKIAVKNQEDEQEEEEEDEFTAEAEIMIAEQAYRRQGLALEALQLMLRYATGCYMEHFSSASENTLLSESSSSSQFHSQSSEPFPTLPNPIPPTSLLCRISEGNAPSIALFEKLGFQVTKRVEVFEEVEMRWRPRS
ncbi:hypothetical protein K435DRAFT_750155 [Dendrothele bispora CBS 962.96]|uniref:N-acetyltransferase domain-containing protein n=1 Tax=Dendrothele bispora (strain CBS 962.96) TaxID=1314807 RepID=A0A4S8MGC3_DENBC|nr:hypothetical protein K435DRAFT_750155 [Dendrothele bispora CBS 962.96]